MPFRNWSFTIIPVSILTDAPTLTFLPASPSSRISSGRDYPDDLKKYKLILHCGACMINRREMLNRLRKAQEAGVPVTNYGVAISFLQGVISRSLAPFPSALLAFENEMNDKKWIESYLMSSPTKFQWRTVVRIEDYGWKESNGKTHLPLFRYAPKQSDATPCWAFFFISLARLSQN